MEEEAASDNIKKDWMQPKIYNKGSVSYKNHIELFRIASRAGIHTLSPKSVQMGLLAEFGIEQHYDNVGAAISDLVKRKVVVRVSHGQYTLMEAYRDR